MDRLHIHFTMTAPFNTDTSGIRKSCDVLIFIDLQRAIDAGTEFWLSHNNVILSSGHFGVIDRSFFLKITDRDDNIIQTHSRYATS